MTTIREATPAEIPQARGILEAALLVVTDEIIDQATVFIAAENQRILGALVVHDGTVHAIAVRPGRRGQGIGSALIQTAVTRRETLVASFDRHVRPFYESLDFEITCGENRCLGRLS